MERLSKKVILKQVLAKKIVTIQMIQMLKIIQKWRNN